MPISVRIVTQEELLFEDDAVDMIIIPGSEGEIGVLPHHAPLLTTLGCGELRIKKGIAEESFIIFGGIAEIRPGHVIVLADMAESSYAADVAEAEKARTRVQELLRVGVPDECKPSLLEELHRAEVALRVARKLPVRRNIRIRTLEDPCGEITSKCSLNPVPGQEHQNS